MRGAACPAGGAQPRLGPVQPLDWDDEVHHPVHLSLPGDLASWSDQAGWPQDEEEQLARREKSGFLVGVIAVFFYPLSWMTKFIQRGNERIPREGGVLLVMN